MFRGEIHEVKLFIRLVRVDFVVILDKAIPFETFEFCCFLTVLTKWSELNEMYSFKVAGLLFSARPLSI